MDEIDRILLTDATLAPSSGFRESVMERVQAATEAPPPLPFLWARFLSGLLASGVAAASAVVVASSVDLSEFRGLSSQLEPVSTELAYAAGAVLASLAVGRLSPRFAKR